MLWMFKIICIFWFYICLSNSKIRIDMIKDSKNTFYTFSKLIFNFILSEYSNCFVKIGKLAKSKVLWFNQVAPFSVQISNYFQMKRTAYNRVKNCTRDLSVIEYAQWYLKMVSAQMIAFMYILLYWPITVLKRSVLEHMIIWSE